MTDEQPSELVIEPSPNELRDPFVRQELKPVFGFAHLLAFDDPRA